MVSSAIVAVSTNQRGGTGSEADAREASEVSNQMTS